jgi:UDP-N-acetylmuramyl pentapeptide synthase
MKLRDLIQHLDKPVTSGSLDVEIKGLTYDSRKAKKGVAFFALRGTALDGHDFIPMALEQSAAAIVALTARRRPLVRVLRMSRRHTLPAYFDIDDPTLELRPAAPV